MSSDTADRCDTRRPRLHQFTARAQQPPYDLLIRGGQIVDGTGNPPFNADVAIRGDRIAAIGRLTDAKRDPGDRRARSRRRPRLHRSPHPFRHAVAQRRQRGEQGAAGRDGRRHRREHVGGARATAWRTRRTPWTDFTGYWRALAQKGISMNVISEVSYNQVRLVVMGYSAGPANAVAAGADEGN